jgi:hypothetical protein
MIVQLPPPGRKPTAGPENSFRPLCAIGFGAEEENSRRRRKVSLRILLRLWDMGEGGGEEVEEEEREAEEKGD